MTKPAKIYYGSFDGQASRFAPSEAWVLSEDKTSWKEINPMSHGQAVHELTKAEFDRKFPNIPPLPADAFTEER